MQKRSHSLIETVFSTALGFLATLGAQFVIYPLFNISTTFTTNFLLTCFFTIISIARGYFVRRLFNWMQHGNHH